MCAQGVACPEVYLRIRAAMRTIHLEGCREHGEELLAIARRIADLHAHGCQPPLEEAS